MLHRPLGDGGAPEALGNAEEVDADGSVDPVHHGTARHHLGDAGEDAR